MYKRIKSRENKELEKNSKNKKARTKNYNMKKRKLKEETLNHDYFIFLQEK